MDILGPGPFDGLHDSWLVKIENNPEAYAHQIAWDAELLGYSPLAKEPKPRGSRIRRALRWFGKVLEAAGSPYDPYAMF